MKKEKCFRVDFSKMIVSIAVGVFLLIMAVIMIMEGRNLSAVVFFALGIIYLREAIRNMPLVSFGTEGVSMKLLGKNLRYISWNEIAEVGLIGTKVFNQRKPEKTGRMYLYFSKEAFNEKSRFELMLKWPPKNIIYVSYNDERLEDLRSVWKGKIETYNIGELRL